MQEKIKNYAKLVIKMGQSVKPGQLVVLRVPTECREFAHVLVEYAYKSGAKKVYLEWQDDVITRLRYEYEPLENFEVVDDFQIEKYKYLIENKASFISVSATDPENLKGIDAQKIMASTKASNKYLKFYSTAIMADLNKWTVISAPTKKWADKVFPNSDDSVTELWQAILSAVRADCEDPIKAWNDHVQKLEAYANVLNTAKIKSLHFTSELGTDLVVELPTNYKFLAAGSTTPENEKFIANIPTEEVFTLPHKTGVNGKVYASKPLNYQGNLIENFMLEFKEGKVVDAKAEKNEVVLKELISVDEGASYLGEVALVSYETPISLSNILYYNTLFDENASCHLALGRAYPTCLLGSEKMSELELEQAGVNDSAIHVDFMFGTKAMDIVATLNNSEKLQVFKDGNFCLDI